MIAFVHAHFLSLPGTHTVRSINNLLPSQRRPLWNILVASIILTTASPAQHRGDVRILREDERSVTVEFTPRLAVQEFTSSEGRPLRRTAFASEIIDDSNPGAAWITYRGIPLQFPTARVVVNVLSSEFHAVKEYPIPVPGSVRCEGFGLSPVYRSGPVRAFTSHDLAGLQDVAPSLETFIGTLRFYPVQYDINTGEAKIYTKIVVQVRFDPWDRPSRKASAPVAGIIRLKSGGLQNHTARAPTADSPLAEGPWYKMKVMQTGVYRIDQAFLKQANISPSSIGDINSIRIFGNGGTMLPEDLTLPRPNGLEEIARHVVDNNGDGVLDEDDCVLFYGCSTRAWTYDASKKSYRHSFSYYCEPDYYFLTFGGAPGIAMDSVASLNAPGAYIPTDFQEKIFLKQEIHNLMSESLGGGAGRQWVGQEFQYTNPSAQYTLALPGYVSTSPVNYRFVFLSRSGTIDTFTVYEHGTQLGSPILMYAPSTVRLTGEVASQDP